MIYISAFIFSGLICFIGEMIYLNTKLTPGHITTLFVILGAILGGIGLYDVLEHFISKYGKTLVVNIKKYF